MIIFHLVRLIHRTHTIDTAGGGCFDINPLFTTPILRMLGISSYSLYIYIYIYMFYVYHNFFNNLRCPIRSLRRILCFFFYKKPRMPIWCNYLMWLCWQNATHFHIIFASKAWEIYKSLAWTFGISLYQISRHRAVLECSSKYFHLIKTVFSETSLNQFLNFEILLLWMQTITENPILVMRYFSREMLKSK